jgi:ribonuclease E
MRSETHRRKVEDAFRDALRRDRARTKILRISQFGLIEMTRQRIRPSLKRSIFADCPHCRGIGFVKTSESLSIEVMRLLQLAAHRAPAVQVVQVTVHPDAANYLLNKRRKEIAGLEERLLPPAPLPKLAAGRFPPGDRGPRGRDDRGGRGDRERGGFPRPLD